MYYNINGGYDLVFYFTYQIDSETKTYKFGALMDEYQEYFTMTFPLGDELVPLAYVPDTDSRVGMYVSWDSDGKNGAETWIVLYDDDTNGLQIISEDTMKYNDNDEDDEDAVKLSLGYDDTYLTEKGTLQGTTYVEKAIYSYNHAIATLNSACQETLPNITGVRCVGSNPTDETAESGYYSSEQLSSFIGGPLLNNYEARAGDQNFISDLDRMVGLGIVLSDDDYWFASRDMQCYYGDSLDFRVLYFSDYLGSHNMCSLSVDDGGTSAPSPKSLRPVVTLDPGITFSGSGTESDPFTF